MNDKPIIYTEKGVRKVLPIYRPHDHLGIINVIHQAQVTLNDIFEVKRKRKITLLKRHIDKELNFHSLTSQEDK